MLAHISFDVISEGRMCRRILILWTGEELEVEEKGFRSTSARTSKQWSVELDPNVSDHVMKPGLQGWCCWEIDLVSLDKLLWSLTFTLTEMEIHQRISWFMSWVLTGLLYCCVGERAELWPGQSQETSSQDLQLSRREKCSMVRVLEVGKIERILTRFLRSL